MLQDALDRFRGRCPDLKSFDELVPEYRSGDHRGRNLDQGDMQGNQCLGGGKSIHPDDRPAVVVLLRKLLIDFPDETTTAAWLREGNLEAADMFEYSRAHASGEEIVHALSYKKSTVRVSSNVFARYDEARLRKSS
jgi:hypothetical protein